MTQRQGVRGSIRSVDAKDLAQRTTPTMPTTDSKCLTERIKSLYESGLSTYQIAASVGISQGAVFKRLKRDGYTLRPKGQRPGKPNYGRRSIGDEEKDRVLGMYRGGESLKSIGDYYGVSHHTVSGTLARWGEPTRRSNLKSKFYDDAQVVCGKLATGEWTAQDVMKEYGVCKSLVYQVASRHLIKIPRTTESLRKQRHPSCVYFLRTVEHAYVKIGHTTNIAMRKSNLQNACPLKLEVMATIPGDARDELALHHRFAEYRIFPRCEWFRLEGELADHIERLKRENAESVGV